MVQTGTKQIQPSIADINRDISPIIQSQAEKNKQACEAKGGTWNGTKCIMPEKTPEAKLTSPEIIKDADTGKISGITRPDGSTFLGLKPDEVRGMVDKWRNDTQLPEGTQLAGTAQNQLVREQRLQQIASQGFLSEQELATLQEAPIDWGQALTAGTLGNLPSVGTRVATAAGVGAGIGSVVPGLGTAVGAVAGGVVGLISGIWAGTQANIKSQQRGEIGAAQDVLTAAKSNLRQLRMIAETDPSKAEEAYQNYYFWIGEVQKAQRQVQLETQGNLNKFMEDGTDILSDFDLFLMPGGYADIQKARLEQAILRGTPATTEELLQVYQEEIANEE